jgi:hypothetical protein
MSIGRKVRAIGVVGLMWAAAWVAAGSALVTWRVLPSFWLRSGADLLRYYLFWAKFFAPCGFIAGATFAASIALFPPLAGSRLSRRWAMGYGLASGVASSVYLLVTGNTPVVLPFFASVFGITGLLTALGAVAVVRRAPSSNPLPDLRL